MVIVVTTSTSWCCDWCCVNLSLLNFTFHFQILSTVKLQLYVLVHGFCSIDMSDLPKDSVSGLDDSYLSETVMLCDEGAHKRPA